MPLILASQSPRRAQLLREAGIAFEQHSPPFADPDQPPDHLRGHEAEQYATSLALQKARSMSEQRTDRSPILAADTICVAADARLVGKPADRVHAEQMLRRFVNSSHCVITGVTLLVPDLEPTAFADTATVWFGQVTDDQLADYLDAGDWRGKAGGYNLFDRQAAGWPITVQGDPTTVVGLPMLRLGPLLAASLNSQG